MQAAIAARWAPIASLGAIGVGSGERRPGALGVRSRARVLARPLEVPREVPARIAPERVRRSDPRGEVGVLEELFGLLDRSVDAHLGEPEPGPGLADREIELLVPFGRALVVDDRALRVSREPEEIAAADQDAEE